MKIFLFLTTWLITGSFGLALLLWLPLFLLLFIIQTFWEAVHEFGLFTTILMVVSFSWLFGGDD